MPTERDVLVGSLLALPKTFNLTNVALWPAMVIQYVGPKAFAGLTVAANGDMTFKADDIDGLTTVDPNIACESTGGTNDATGIIDLSTPHANVDTFGELEAWINNNGRGNWRCYLVGVRPEESTDNTLFTKAVGTPAAGVGVLSDNGLTLFIDQTTLVDVGMSITNEKFMSRPTKGWSSFNTGWLKNIGDIVTAPTCVNALCYSDTKFTQVNGSAVKVYSVDPVTNTSTLLYAAANAASTVETAIGATPSAGQVWVRASPGCRMLIKIDAVDSAMTVASLCTIIGQTTHLFGGQVAGANFAGVDARTT